MISINKNKKTNYKKKNNKTKKYQTGGGIGLPQKTLDYLIRNLDLIATKLKKRDIDNDLLLNNLFYLDSDKQRLKILYGEDIVSDKINEVITKLTEYIKKHLNQEKEGVYLELGNNVNNNGPLPPIPGKIPVINANKDGLYEQIANNNIPVPPQVPPPVSNRPRPKLT